jgi:hypothetical protein
MGKSMPIAHRLAANMQVQLEPPSEHHFHRRLQRRLMVREPQRRKSDSLAQHAHIIGVELLADVGYAIVNLPYHILPSN